MLACRPGRCILSGTPELYHFEYNDFSIASAQAAVAVPWMWAWHPELRKLAGDEVVQLYICDEYGCVPRPVKS